MVVQHSVLLWVCLQLNLSCEREREREREREISYEEIDYVQNLGEIMTTIFLSVSFGFCWNRDETATFKELWWVFPLQ